ncbi:hypothetical protein FSP39_015579 [Pinctada imbricata]|uniref:Mitochondria-eating protein n=1 Tax=Pinctada imbricata TaxID=66713 RepID=A0AA89C8Y7_PINIB|nr:hypothetical protein FSP39_015579 [Pinctada imbricata]
MLTCTVQGFFLRSPDAALKKEIENLKEELERIQRESQATVDKLQKKLNVERKAKEDALTRLSSAAASRLRDNNPGITDLSDPNRPLKLSERASELYDNEWTNAMERLEMERSSTKANKTATQMAEIKDVHLLRNILTESFKLCHNAAIQQLDSYPELIVMPKLVDSPQNKIKVPSLPSELCKPLKDFRKNHAFLALDELFKVFSEEIKKTLRLRVRQYKACEVYIKECIELCWLMAVQDPPLHIEWEYQEGDKFDPAKMRSYTHSGDMIDYVVWPVLYLYENGPLLAKGVVQGKKGERS